MFNYKLIPKIGIIDVDEIISVTEDPKTLTVFVGLRTREKPIFKKSLNGDEHNKILKQFLDLLVNNPKDPEPEMTLFPDGFEKEDPLF